MPLGAAVLRFVGEGLLRETGRQTSKRYVPTLFDWFERQIKEFRKADHPSLSTHRFSDGEYRFWKKSGTQRFVEVITPATLVHEEHDSLLIAPGIYEQVQEREYDYLEQERIVLEDRARNSQQNPLPNPSSRSWRSVAD